MSAKPSLRPSPGRSFAILVTVAVIAMISGLVLGRSVRSPAQQALDTRAPAKTIITAPVTEQRGSSPVTTRGTVSLGQSVSIGPIRASTAVSLITGVFVRPGEVVRPGRRLLEVSGRPVFLLQGRFGAYRDLRVGDSGPDAAQVNQALTSLGFAAPRGATYTGDSAAALGGLYRRFGYPPPPDGRLDRREVAFVPDRQAVVTAVAAVVGAGAGSADLLSLSSGRTVVTANLDPQAARTVRIGTAATVFLDGSGGPVPARVSAVAVGADLAATTVVLTPAVALPARSGGADVRVEIQEQATGVGILSVPVTAVFSQPSGQTAVVKVVHSQGQVVAVDVGAAVGGFVTITPIDKGSLRIGDQVEVSGPGLR